MRTVGWSVCFFPWLSMVFSRVFLTLKFKNINIFSILFLQSSTFISIVCHRANHCLHYSDLHKYRYILASEYLLHGCHYHSNKNAVWIKEIDQNKKKLKLKKTLIITTEMVGEKARKSKNWSVLGKDELMVWGWNIWLVAWILCQKSFDSLPQD